MPTDIGTNRINWNIRYDNPPAFNHNYAQVMGGVPSQTQYTPQGRWPCRASTPSS